MPHLDARALDTDPEGMELLRAAIAPQPAVTASLPPPFNAVPAARSEIRMSDRIMTLALMRLPLRRAATAL